MRLTSTDLEELQEWGELPAQAGEEIKLHRRTIRECRMALGLPPEDVCQDMRLVEADLVQRVVDLASGQLEQELAAMIRRLVRRLRKVNPDDDAAEKAHGFLQRKGLLGSILRNDS